MSDSDSDSDLDTNGARCPSCDFPWSLITNNLSRDLQPGDVGQCQFCWAPIIIVQDGLRAATQDEVEQFNAKFAEGEGL